MRNTGFTGILVATILAMTAANASAQDYPAKPIKVVVPYPPGGSVDALARIVAEKLREKWRQPVIVENRGGAGGNIGAEAVWRSPPDGYTLLFAAPGPYVINRFLYGKLSYDPDTFVPIGVVSASNTVLIASPKAAFGSLQELIEFAKKNPGQLNYASSGSGTASHLAAESFISQAGIKIGHVPYKGSGPGMSDVAAGHVDMMFVELSAALPLVRGNKVHVLGVGSEVRKSALPGVPAITEALPGYVSTTWFGMVAPPLTPTAVTDKLSSAVAELLKQPDVAGRLAEMNVDAVGSTAEQMTAFMKQENERWGSVVRSTGAKAD